MEDRIVELLGAGISAAVVAATVGCDPSYISQLGAREDIAQRIAELRAKKASEYVQHDSDIHELEKEALVKIGRLLPMQTDLMKVVQTFKVLNAAKKSSDIGVTANSAQPQAVVTLTLPAAAHIHFKLTTDQQVVEIEGRSMVPLPSNMVAQKLRTMKADRLLEAALVQRETPAIGMRARSIVDQL